MKNRNVKTPQAALLALMLLLGSSPCVHAVELLSNGDFELPGTGNPATDWVAWSWGNGWANTEQAAWGSGSYHIAVGASGGGGGGYYQEVAGVPGVEYTLTVSSGADAWWLPTGMMEMFFLDNTDALISSTNRFTVDPAVYGETNYDIAHPWSNYTLVATAPAGTAKIKVELSANNATGSVGFDDASLTAPIDPPVIADVYPNGLLMPTNTFSFTASSVVPIEGSGIGLVLNGVDVSGSLIMAGAGTTNVSVSYSGLEESNAVYTAVITVTDTANLSSFKNVAFDTYAPLFTWEAEDYNYGGGSYINDPTPSDVPVSGSYFGLVGIDGVDYHDYSADGTNACRLYDAMATQEAPDGIRQKFVDAGASDYNVGWFNGGSIPDLPNDGIDTYNAGEWVNYTRDFPAGTYHLYGRLANGNGGTATIRLSRVTSDPTLSGQTTAALGVFRFPAISWVNYAYVPLSDELGNPVAVTFSGTETLRVSAGSGGNLNFFMLMPVDASQPTITGLYPDGRTLLQGTNQLAFTVSTASSSIAQSNVVVTLNGADISGSLSFSGSSSSWDVTGPLALGVTNYTMVVNVTDDVGNSHSVTVYFDTFDPASFVVEAEDYDYDSGNFIDDPVITSANAANSYFDHPQSGGQRVGINLVDVYVGDNPELDMSLGTFRYRALDDMRTDICSDTPMQKLLDAQTTDDLAFNYNVSYMRSNSWLNYTRTYPAGDYNVYGRLASDRAYSIRFDEVGGTTNFLGNFVGNGRGWPFFDWIPLTDTNGALAQVTLGGETTLRLTTPAGEVNPNSFVFVPAVTLPVPLQWSYVGEVLKLWWDDPAFRLQSQTNAPGAGISAGWSDYPGGETSPVNVVVDPSQGSLFFRLTD